MQLLYFKDKGFFQQPRTIIKSLVKEINQTASNFLTALLNTNIVKQFFFFNWRIIALQCCETKFLLYNEVNQL